MRTIAVIPSRLQSSRFPEKPLALIAGMSMVERVWRVAAEALSADNVFVATDNDKIFQHVESFGGQAVMTSPECRNGSERVAECVDTLGLTELGAVINVQGDSPLLPPWVIEQLKTFMENEQDACIATPAVTLSRADFERYEKKYSQGEVGGTFVTVSLSGKALYFSKAPIPSIKRSNEKSPLVRKHIGLYAFRPETLQTFVNLDPTPLEQLEQLEQLRALENDLPIHVVEVDYRGRTAHSVDNPDDVKIVEGIIASEGELL